MNPHWTTFNNKDANTIGIDNKGKDMNNKMLPIDLPFGNEHDKYRGAAIRWLDETDHYELIFTDDFVTPSSNSQKYGKATGGIFSLGGNSILTDVILDMRKGNKQKEVHVFVGSFGGEVAALSMILQQLLCYEHRVGINLGTACSCGWMLLFACPERYVSPFSQTMYHDISNLAFGKHSELRSNAEFMSLWQKELLHVTQLFVVKPGDPSGLYSAAVTAKTIAFAVIARIKQATVI